MRGETLAKTIDKCLEGTPDTFAYEKIRPSVKSHAEKNSKTDPSSVQNQPKRSSAYKKPERYDAVRNDFKNGRKFRPSLQKRSHDFLFYNNRGIQKSRKKLFEDAIEDFSTAININPKYLSSYLSRGVAYKNLQAYDKALQDFNMCIENNSTYTKAYYNRALTYYAKNQYDAALKDLLRIVTGLNADYKMAHYLLGEIYFKQKNYRKALTHFERVIKLDSKYIWAYYWKGITCENLKLFEPAINSYRKFLAYVPEKHFKHIAHVEIRLKDLKRHRKN